MSVPPHALIPSSNRDSNKAKLFDALHATNSEYQVSVALFHIKPSRRFVIYSVVASLVQTLSLCFVNLHISVL